MYLLHPGHLHRLDLLVVYFFREEVRAAISLLMRDREGSARDLWVRQ